jgi:hypothetical protein
MPHARKITAHTARTAYVAENMHDTDRNHVGIASIGQKNAREKESNSERIVHVLAGDSACLGGNARYK